MSKILIVGCGDIGIPLGLKLADDGLQVWGLRRSSSLPDPIQTITANVCLPETLIALTTMSFDYVVVTLTPGSFNDQAYQSVFVDGLANVLAALGHRKMIKRVIFVSSTSVYHQADGQWVDEDSATEPVRFSGQRLLQAEQLLAQSGFNYSIVRFAGIYGPGRGGRLIEQVRAQKGCAQWPEVYTNRIHRDDCIGFLAHLITLDQQGVSLWSCYIGADGEPVTLWNIKHWLAAQLGIDSDTLTEEGCQRSGSKRCSNQRLLDSGYRLQYKNYQQGYSELLPESLM